jgi:hypothetical protein
MTKNTNVFLAFVFLLIAITVNSQFVSQRFNGTMASYGNLTVGLIPESVSSTISFYNNIDQVNADWTGEQYDIQIDIDLGAREGCITIFDHFADGLVNPWENNMLSVINFETQQSLYFTEPVVTFYEGYSFFTSRRVCFSLGTVSGSTVSLSLLNSTDEIPNRVPKWNPRTFAYFPIAASVVILGMIIYALVMNKKRKQKKFKKSPFRNGEVKDELDITMNSDSSSRLGTLKSRFSWLRNTKAFKVAIVMYNIADKLSDILLIFSLVAMFTATGEVIQKTFVSENTNSLTYWMRLAEGNSLFQNSPPYSLEDTRCEGNSRFSFYSLSGTSWGTDPPAFWFIKYQRLIQIQLKCGPDGNFTFKSLNVNSVSVPCELHSGNDVSSPYAPFFCSIGNSLVMYFLFLIMLSSIIWKDFVIISYEEFIIFNLNEEDQLTIRSYSIYGLIYYIRRWLRLRWSKARAEKDPKLMNIYDTTFVDNLKSTDMAVALPRFTFFLWLAEVLCRTCSSTVAVAILISNNSSEIAIFRLVLSCLSYFKSDISWVLRIRRVFSEFPARTTKSIMRSNDPFYHYFTEKYRPNVRDTCLPKRLHNMLTNPDLWIGLVLTSGGIFGLVNFLEHPTTQNLPNYYIAGLLSISGFPIFIAKRAKFVIKKHCYTVLSRKDFLQMVAIQDARILMSRTSPKYAFFMKELSQTLGLKLPCSTWCVQTLDFFCYMIPLVFVAALTAISSFGKLLPFWADAVICVTFTCLCSLIPWGILRCVLKDAKAEQITRDIVQEGVLSVFGVPSFEELMKCMPDFEPEQERSSFPELESTPQRKRSSWRQRMAEILGTLEMEQPLIEFEDTKDQSESESTFTVHKPAKISTPELESSIFSKDKWRITSDERS